MSDKTKPRKIKSVGGSLTLILPKDVGLEDGDYVSVNRIGNSSTVLLTKIVREGDVQQPQPEIKITKEVVIGFLITMCCEGYVHTHPITGTWDEITDGIDYPFNTTSDRVLGILPAPENTFKIFGYTNEDTRLVKLGYEYSGGRHPDWVKEYPTAKHYKELEDAEDGVIDLRDI